MADGVAPASKETDKWFSKEPAFAKLISLGHFDKLRGLDEKSQRFEIIVRENIVQGDHLSREDVSALSEAVGRYCESESGTADKMAFLLFFICFEWNHRQLNDVSERQLAWKKLFKAAGSCFSDYAMFSYALSLYYRAEGTLSKALEFACRACEQAPKHIGLLNSYLEMLLDETEQSLLSGPGVSADQFECPTVPDEDTKQLQGLLDRFQSMTLGQAFDQDFPTFHINLGRLRACLGFFGDARREFDRAEELAVGQFEAKSKSDNEGERLHSSSEYVQLIAWIATSRTTCDQMQGARSLRAYVEMSREGIQEMIESLLEKHAEVERRVNDEKINMVEMLAFFAGIIALIVGAVSLGSGMSFAARGLLLLVMLGVLMVAFGALSFLLEADRSAQCSSTGNRLGFAASFFAARSAPVVAIGFAVIVLCFVLGLVLPPGAMGF